MIIKKIESKIKLAFTISVLSFLLSILIVTGGLVYSFKLINDYRKNIYVLSEEGIPLLANRTNITANRELEIKSHVTTFHLLFFTLPPDDEFIKANMEKAMYLIDDSGLKQYNNLKEQGYYNQILSTTANLTIKIDSIFVKDSYFKIYAEQRIERKTSILKRSLVTEGFIRDVKRTVNNPHGLIIEKWKTLKNQDLSYKSKNTF